MKSIEERDEDALKFRVRKGVRPYGGRILNGRRQDGVVILYAPTSAGNSAMQRDERTYTESEVEEV